MCMRIVICHMMSCVNDCCCGSAVSPNVIPKVDTKEAWILALRCGNALPKFVKLVFAPQISNMVYSFGKLGFKPEQTLLACAENAMQDC